MGTRELSGSTIGQLLQKLVDEQNISFLVQEQVR